MAMARIWTCMTAFAVVFGLVSGRMDAVCSGALEGASAAVELCIKICGVTCLWCGIMEVMSKAGITEKLSKALYPILRRLFRGLPEGHEAFGFISANAAANMLGLGNAATPMGIKAAEKLSDGTGRANDWLCTLVVINTASIQIIPSTVAAIRAAEGSPAPFIILPQVWISSVAALSVGLAAAGILRRLWGS
ncbi:MAG: spore maturation protein A [Oscillospiraceae bacterium]|nr:spore maturation protein A [Oscillospiraceae bacterium]